MSRDPTQPKVPTERPDPEAAARPSGDQNRLGIDRPGTDRPGMDLGGSSDRSGAAGTVPEGGPVRDPALGEGRPTRGSDETTGGGTPA